jgi:hypothetical protein
VSAVYQYLTDTATVCERCVGSYGADDILVQAPEDAVHTFHTTRLRVWYTCDCCGERSPHVVLGCTMLRCMGFEPLYDGDSLGGRDDSGQCDHT